MPVLAIVATLSPDQHDAVLTTLAAQADLLVGDLVDGHLPLALDVDDPAAVEPRFQTLLGIPGLLHLDLVWADLSDLHLPTERLS